MLSLPELPYGFELAPRPAHIQDKWMWSYPGALGWLPSKLAGQAQPENNIYAKPKEKSDG